MNNLSFYIYTLKRLSLVLLIYFLLRVFFLAFNWQEFLSLSFTDLFLSFIYGLRFDIWAILYTNIPLTLISAFVPSLNVTYQKGLRIAFVVVNFIPVTINIIDLEFFKFTNKRIDSAVLDIAGDIKEQASQLLIYYWYMWIIGVFLIVVFWKLYPIQTVKKIKLNLITGTLAFITLIGLNFLGMRGGWQLKPLTTIAAYKYGALLGNLSLNSTFTFMSSLDKGTLEPLKFYQDDELKRMLEETRVTTPDSVIGIGEEHNVVIIIVESLAAEYTGFMNSYKGYTPFLDSLAGKGMFFKKSFANGRRSDEAVPSIFSGIPSMMYRSITTSMYQNNHFYSLFNDAKKNAGYQSAFYHGGKNGTMGFNSFVTKLGMDYYGKDEYPNADDYDGNWGIFDEPYLQYFADELSNYESPFIAAAFTLSSHQPYTIPEQHKNKFDKGKHPIHETIGYADYALEQFFKKVSKTSWYDSTLFIITADHTHHTVEPSYQNTLGHYRVPMLLFHPSLDLKMDTSRVVQQVDILATISDFLGLSNRNIPYFSQSMFGTSPGFSLFHLNKNYYMVRENDYLKMVENTISRYNWDDSIIAEEENKGAEQLKMFRQYYNSGMINNSFYK